MQAYVLELRALGPPGDAQQKGGPLLIPAGVLQDVGEHEPIQLPVDLPVHVAGVGAKPLADERLRIEVTPRGRRRRGWFRGRFREFGKEVRQQDRAVGT